MTQAPQISVIAPTSGAPSHTFVREHVRALASAHSFVTLASDRNPWPEAINLNLSPVARNLAMGIARRPNRRLAIAVSGASIIHAHFGQVGWLVAPTARAAGLPLVVTAHGSEIAASSAALRRDGIGSALWALSRSRFLTHSETTWVAVSESLATRMRDRGVDRDRIHVIPNPLPHTLPAPMPRCDRHGVLFVGRLVEVKGAHQIVDIARALRLLGNEQPIDVVGDGPLRSAIERAAVAEHLPIRIHGTCDHARSLTMMAAAIAVIVPSVADRDGRVEALGMTSIEAQAVETPVIASRIGGLPETLSDGIGGFLVEPLDPAAVAERVHAVSVDPDLADRLGTAGVKFVRARFGRETVLDRLRSLYDEVAAR